MFIYEKDKVGCALVTQGGDYKVVADNKEMMVTNSDDKQQLFICIIA